MREIMELPHITLWVAGFPKTTWRTLHPSTSPESDIMDALAIAEESLAAREAELREIEKRKTNTVEFNGQFTIWNIHQDDDYTSVQTDELNQAA